MGTQGWAFVWGAWNTRIRSNLPKVDVIKLPANGGRDNTLLRWLQRRLTSCSSERINRSIASFSIVLKWQFTFSTQFNVHLSVFWYKALETNSKTFDTGKVYSRMWHWGISVKKMPQKILAVRSFLRRGLFCVVGRQKRKSPSDVPSGLLLCDYGYPAKASAEERG